MGCCPELLGLWTSRSSSVPDVLVCTCVEVAHCRTDVWLSTLHPRDFELPKDLSCVQSYKALREELCVVCASCFGEVAQFEASSLHRDTQLKRKAIGYSELHTKLPLKRAVRKAPNVLIPVVRRLNELHACRSRLGSPIHCCLAISVILFVRARSDRVLLLAATLRMLNQSMH